MKALKINDDVKVTETVEVHIDKHDTPAVDPAPVITIEVQPVAPPVVEPPKPSKDTGAAVSERSKAAEMVSGNWSIVATGAETIRAYNNMTGRVYEGEMPGFKAILRGK
jgi:hypothetical protein